MPRRPGSILHSPYACACAAILSGPSAIPISANGTLHDEVKACSIVTVDAPPAQNSSPKFSICVVVPGNSRWWGFFQVFSGGQLLSSAALAVIVLNVEPGR